MGLDLHNHVENSGCGLSFMIGSLFKVNAQCSWTSHFVIGNIGMYARLKLWWRLAWLHTKKINFLIFLDHFDAVSISGAPAVAVTCCFSESSVETRHHLNMIQENIWWIYKVQVTKASGGCSWEGSITEQLKVHKVVICFQIIPNTFCRTHTHFDSGIKNKKVSLNGKVVF